MMAEHGATLGSARDLRARVMLALISACPAKPSAGRAAALVEEARTIMRFIDAEPEPVPEAANDTSAGPDDATAPPADRHAET